MSKRSSSRRSYVETEAIAAHDAQAIEEFILNAVRSLVGPDPRSPHHPRTDRVRFQTRFVLEDLLWGKPLAVLADEGYRGALDVAMADFQDVLAGCRTAADDAGFTRDSEFERALGHWLKQTKPQAEIVECPRHGPCEAPRPPIGKPLFTDLSGKCKQCPCFLPVDLAEKGARKRGRKAKYCTPACRQAGYRLRRDEKR
ncbi:hypothetical protein AB0M12_40215 [Nocardia vinacea]|uniref:hypothetical protein n=1 Tax=Nocardia vinacea TaxID=96468 RepID=UPI00343D2CF8